MERRKFIKEITLSLAGLSIANLLFSCKKEGLLLDKIIGKPESILSNFKKEGNKDFSYYRIPETRFSHVLFSGSKAFVFCKKDKIIGYTIMRDETDKAKKYKNKLIKKYGTSKLMYDNNFGEKYSWNTTNRELNLSYTKNISSLAQNLYYSESILNHGLIVF